MNDAKKIADDIYMVPWSEGNGQIRREAWVEADGRVARYSLVYINTEILESDGGKVLGYELRDGSLNVHRMGTVSKIDFNTIVEVEEIFAVEWGLMPKQNEPQLSPAASQQDLATDAYADTKEMQLTITKGSSADFFRRGKELASRVDRRESVTPEKVVIFGDRHDLCYSQMPKR